MKKLLVILAIFSATNASAGILFEPYVGYHLSKGEQGGAEADITGLGYGGRIGWTMPMIFIAFDYSIAGVEFESDTAGNEPVDADYKAMGAVIGASLPAFRIWAGYNFSAELDIKDDVKFEGSGMKGGLGFKMALVSFNVEYIINSYDKGDGITMTPEYEQKGLFVSLSAPFDL